MPILTVFGFTFVWRDDKWEAVYDKRKVEIDEAVSVFNDPYQKTAIDNRFKYTELRMNTIGFSNKGRLLVVSWYELDETTIRIITAYKPTQRQIKEYNDD